MHRPRPALTPSLSPGAFREAYWLKKELVTFCRQHGLATSGPKREVAARIAAFLTDGTRLTPAPSARRTGAMPDTFSRETVIGAGWRCSQALRAFFEREAGPGFHFNAAMRAFVRDGEGRTLEDALAVWTASQKEASREIAPQFEYNRFVRDYHAEHPGTSHADVAAAWARAKAERNQRATDA